MKLITHILIIVLVAKLVYNSKSPPVNSLSCYIRLKVRNFAEKKTIPIGHAVNNLLGQSVYL